MRADRLIDIEPWQAHPEIPEILYTLKTAILENKIITFQYKKARGKIEPQIVSPYGLFYRSGLCYLVGFSHKRNAIRIFRTNRFRKTTLTEEKFRQDQKFNLTTFGAKELPKEYENKKSEVIIVFDRSVANSIKKTTWGAEKTRKLKNGKLELSLKTYDKKKLISFVLSFGSKAEIIKPASLRQHILKESGKIMQNYSIH